MAPLYVLNRGFGGSQIREVTYYVPRIVTPYQPRAIVFYAGENDMAGVLFSRQKSPEEIQLAFRDFCRAVHLDLPAVPIYFIAIKPPKTRRKHWPAMQVGNRLVREYCTTDTRLHFIDVVPDMLDQAGNPRLDLFVWDGVHMNRKGYEIWTSRVKPTLMQAVL
jgi:lysophospholipase L1-like esterase